MFGDPGETGKPAGDDLREGKRTVLLAHALAGTDAPGRARVEALLGRPDLDAGQVDELRAVIGGSGAVERLEGEIDTLAGSARAALDGAASVDEEARAALLDLVGIATARSS